MNIQPIAPTRYVEAPQRLSAGAAAPPSSADSGGVVLQLGRPSMPEYSGYDAKGMPAGGGRTEKMNKSENTKQEGEPCKTCSERQYQDGSDDMGVSFKAATSIAPEAAAALVRAHEQEHVSHEGAKAREMGLNAVSTVRIHTDICPECKKVYVAGGTTTTQFSADPNKVVDAYMKQMGQMLGIPA